MKKTAEKAEVGLACPRCGHRHLPVIYTRPKTQQVMRMRECRHCGRRMLTRERVG